MPPPTDPTRSLMDDAEFLAELEKLERKAPLEPAANRSLSDLSALDAGLIDKEKEPEHVHVPITNWSQLPAFSDEEEAPATRPSTTRVALAVGAFLAMMALGAGAAAYVFRDRVALILSLAGR
jgi:hypothetical protein